MRVGRAERKADTPGVTHVEIWTIEGSHTLGCGQFWCHRLGKGHLGSQILRSREVASTCLGIVGDFEGGGQCRD